jgi:hypothetical protein
VLEELRELIELTANLLRGVQTIETEAADAKNLELIILIL